MTEHRISYVHKGEATSERGEPEFSTFRIACGLGREHPLRTLRGTVEASFSDPIA
jgi:hypothetical protein